MRLPSPSPVEPRHRLSSQTDETSKRRSLRNRDAKDLDKGGLHGSFQYRNWTGKFSTLKVVLVLIVLGTVYTLYRSPAVHIADHPSNNNSRWMMESSALDPRYVSSAEIHWDHMSDVVEKLTGKSGYQGVGFINLNDDEIAQWKDLIPDCDHVALHLGHMKSNITWESLYPEWIDEEEQFEVPTCPSLPWIQVPGKPRLDLVVVKLPCNKAGKWSRDVVRLHLQLAAARVAASSKGLHDVHVLFITDCFPIPNLFIGKELVSRQGNLWLFKPNLHQLRQKVQLPIGSCELTVPLKAKDTFYSASAKREAYATILHSANFYVCGAITAAQSIRMAGSTRDLVILVDDSITEHHRSGLAAAGWKIYSIQRIRNPKAEAEAYNEWNYSKFRLWQLTEYDKIIFIDADMLILRNIDFLFEMPEISATGNNATLFNSGVMVVEPSNSTFQLLMDHINEIVSYNGGDQGYLNEVYTWWHRIPKHMNFLKHFWEGDEPEIKQMKTRLFGTDPPILYVLHYLGNKPWLCFRDYDCNWNVDILQEFASDVAHKTWWRVHDAMPENLQKFCLLRSKQKAQLEWDRMQAEKGNYTDGHWKIKIKDKRLETCYEDFCYWESMLWHWGDKNWTDNSTNSLSPPPALKTPLSSLGKATSLFSTSPPPLSSSPSHHSLHLINPTSCSPLHTEPPLPSVQSATNEPNPKISAFLISTSLILNPSCSMSLDHGLDVSGAFHILSSMRSCIQKLKITPALSGQKSGRRCSWRPLELWTLPAGYLEVGESAAEGAMRETWEEAGATVEVISPFAQFDIPLIGQTYVIFLARLKNLDFAPGPESLECRLFALDEIPFDSLAFSSIYVICYLKLSKYMYTEQSRLLCSLDSLDF
ncbi:hypothetical protein Bca101_070478 [Brassica carinata]